MHRREILTSRIAEGAANEDGTVEEKAELLPNPVSSSQPWLAKARLQTHFELLWRTLIADCWENQHPAPVAAGYAFANAVIARMQLLCLDVRSEAAEAKNKTEPEPGSAQPTAKGDAASKLEALYEAYEVLAESERNGFTRLDTSEAVGEFDVPAMRNFADPLVADLPREKKAETLTQFLPEFAIFSDMLRHRVDMAAVRLWTRRFGQFMPGRRLFSTQPYQFLGAGPKSLQVGDVVAMLGGAEVPCVLRRIGEPAENRYTFVGEVYVHGMMHGEVNYIMLEEEVNELSEIILV